MKIILALTATIFFVACSKRTDAPYVTEKNSSINQKIMNEVTSMPSTQAMKNSYNLLSAGNKSEIWKQHLQNYLTDKSLSNFQKEIVGSFISVISPEIFMSRETGRAFLAKEEVAKLVYTSKKAFTINQIYNIFGKLGGETTSFEEDPGSGCTCNASSSFCSGQNVTCINSMWQCTTSSSGCGWLWLQECNGRCGWTPS